MQIKEANKLVDTQIEKLLESLQHGKSEGLQTYLKAITKFRKYSFTNLMLILSQCPDASDVDGFKGWQKRGRFIVKGSKAIKIIAPIVKKSDCDDSEIFFRAINIFDVSQTDGEAIPEMTTDINGEPGEYLPKLTNLINSHNIKLTLVTDLQGAKGVSMGGEIQILNNLNPAETFSTLVHELAHELLHRNTERAHTKAQRELEAESVAAIVCEACNLSTMAASKDYIQFHTDDIELFKQSLVEIKKVSCQILDSLTT